jgi:hypothetical protein
MKNSLLFIILFLSIFNLIQGQTTSPINNVVITSNKKKTQVHTDEKGNLHLNVSPKNVSKFKTKGIVCYGDFGAKGDGKADDIDAIAITHAFANLHGLTVRADKDESYYISGKKRIVRIQTDTDFGTAAFIIDDSEVEDRTLPVFLISSSLQPFKPEGISYLKKNQEKINLSLPRTSIITVNNSEVKQYIRFGKNQNNGSPQTDIFIVDNNGNVDSNAPIIWDFDQITDITALPIDNNKITIKGGRFTTIANRAESKYTYYHRNISIKRSNVIVDGLEHRITGEQQQGAPYAGFLFINNCANVIVQNTILTGHKTYQTIGAAGELVSMGSYDIGLNRALNVSFVNCKQTNDIHDNKYWGIIASNFSKNLVYDNCTFSRFDAHMGVANATIRNSTLGYQGINAIGSGTFIVENSTIYSRNLINLRSDYGSTWQGDFIIRDCVFVPSDDKKNSPSIIGGSYSGEHNFGYTCYLPEQISIENLKIEDAKLPENYEGIAIFSDFNPKMKDSLYVEKFPFVITKEVILKNMTTTSGKTVRLSDNLYMFRNLKIINK